MAGRTARTWSRARDGGRQSGWWKGHLWMAAQLTRCFHKTKKHTTESFHILIYNAAFLPSKTRQPFLQLREATVSMFRKGVLLLCQRRHGGEHPFPPAVCTQRLCAEPQVPAGEAARSGSRLVKAREGSATYVQRSPKGATGAPAHAVPTRLAFSFPPKPAAPGLAVHLVLPSHGLTGAALLLPWPLHMCLFVTIRHCSRRTRVRAATCCWSMPHFSTRHPSVRTIPCTGTAIRNPSAAPKLRTAPHVSGTRSPGYGLTLGSIMPRQHSSKHPPQNTAPERTPLAVLAFQRSFCGDP